MKILVVEDDVMTIEALVDHLQIEGHEVEVVTTIEDAMDRYHSTRYDIIFSDVMFGRGEFFTSEETDDGRYSGLKLVEYIRSYEKDQDNQTRIIIITNWRNDARVDAVAKRCHAIVCRKPLTILQIGEALK